MIDWAEMPTVEEKIDADINAFYLEKYMADLEKDLDTLDALQNTVRVSEATRLECARILVAAKTHNYRL